MSANRDNLNSFMDFDHVIEVDADGVVTDAPGTVWAPDVWMNESDPRNPDVDGGRETWELLSGYSGQFTYSGPIMHPSEYIGGKMADDILSTPGTYVAVVVSEVDGENEPGGWAVARLVKDA